MTLSTNRTFDLIVIGAGINGAGIARDAAMRGLKVLLLDKGDIGGGTSSASTRLIHGGLRYLEHAEISLVRESLRERERLLRIAPHLVKALQMLIPIYESSDRGRWTIQAGMLAYDLFSRGKSLPGHHMLSRDETIRLIPGINTRGLTGGASYFDCQAEFAERLVLENVISATQHNAIVQTYCDVTNLNVEKTPIEVFFTKILTGEHDSASAAVVINAAGPWVDEVLARTGHDTRKLVGGTKGSHIVVGQFTEGPKVGLYVEAQTDRRPFFIIPWNKQYLIGTTNIVYTASPDDAKITDGEIDYLLAETNHVLPAANLSREAIRFAYSGVRPLAMGEGKHDEGATRRHFLREQSGLISIVGGKLTTYRQVAEEAVDLIARRLNRRLEKCRTATTELPGGTALSVSAAKLANNPDLPSSLRERLLGIYGSRAIDVLEPTTHDRSLLRTIDRSTGMIGAEVLFAFSHELAQTLSDCFLRRTMVGLTGACDADVIAAAGEIGRQYLEWSDERVKSEILECQKELRRLKISHLNQREANSC